MKVAFPGPFSVKLRVPARRPSIANRPGLAHLADLACLRRGTAGRRRHRLGIFATAVKAAAG